MRLRWEPAQVTLTLEDDGIGLPPDALARSGCIGLRSMGERVAEHGGSIEFSQRRRGGTCLRACEAPPAAPGPGIRTGHTLMLQATTSAPLRILLVDDHAIVREGLQRILESTPERWVALQAESGFEALQVLRTQAVDLAIIDLSMPGMPGLDLLRRIKAEFPTQPVLVLSMHAEEQYALRVFKAGANGYVTKDRAAAELVTAVRKVSGGGAYVTSTLAERVVLQLNGAMDVPRHTQLSDRELDVLRRLVAGQRLTEIADALHLSVKTVSTHKTRIQEKLQLPTMAALIRYGIDQGMDGPDGQAQASRTMPLFDDDA
jgi:DNA-binding NarL/FixJ family response regulator